MGLWRLHEFNLALLCKQGWKLMLEPTSLLTPMLKARYFPHSTFLQASLGNNPSYTWHSIWATLDILHRHSRLSVGNGASILVTKDPWLSVDGLGMVTTKLGDTYKEVRVEELFQPRTQQWDRDLFSCLLNPRDRELILNMPLNLKCTTDQWYWTADDMGLYSVKSGYKIQCFHVDEDKETYMEIVVEFIHPPKMSSLHMAFA